MPKTLIGPSTKPLLAFVVANFVVSVGAWFIVRAVWGAEAPWWYFFVAGVIDGAWLWLLFEKAGWWD